KEWKRAFSPRIGGKYEGSGRDRGLTPFPRTPEEQGSKIQKRGAESTIQIGNPPYFPGSRCSLSRLVHGLDVAFILIHVV
ncbi:hypothetical protein, partial [Methanomethylophilus alvi]|uniref:hypothetical protein n=1 Tax=Methanomethylophilus alvi TaxID=1291540 RepID=UPI0037DDD0A2